MVADPELDRSSKSKPVVLGRSAATGRVVFVPVVTQNKNVSDKRIEAAVKTALARKT